MGVLLEEIGLVTKLLLDRRQVSDLNLVGWRTAAGFQTPNPIHRVFHALVRKNYGGAV